jgi:hypothetical protein
MQISESSIGDCDGDRGTTEPAIDAYGSPRLDNAGRVVFAHLALVRVFGFPRALLWLGACFCWRGLTGTSSPFSTACWIEYNTIGLSILLRLVCLCPFSVESGKCACVWHCLSFSHCSCAESVALLFRFEDFVHILVAAKDQRVYYSSLVP